MFRNDSYDTPQYTSHNEWTQGGGGHGGGGHFGGDGSGHGGGGGGFGAGGGNSRYSGGGGGGGGSGGSGRPESIISAVTIRQLLNADFKESKAFTIDGRDMEVTLVALVHSIQWQAANIDYHLSDGTGEILGRAYGQSHQENITENMYVRVVGHLRFINGARIVLFSHISPLRSANEITYHNLDVIWSHLRRTKGPPPVAGAASSSHASMYGVAGASGSQLGGANLYGGGFGSSGSAGGAGGVGAGGAGGTHGELSPLHVQVLHLVATLGQNSVSGASLQQVHNQLGGTISMQQLSEVVQALAENGEVYNTSDEYYKCTS